MIAQACSIAYIQLTSYSLNIRIFADFSLKLLQNLETTNYKIGDTLRRKLASASNPVVLVHGPLCSVARRRASKLTLASRGFGLTVLNRQRWSSAMSARAPALSSLLLAVLFPREVTGETTAFRKAYSI